MKTLTSITNEELAQGRQFMQVQSRFCKWAGESVLLTWGTSDILTLIENYRYFCGSEKIPFLTAYVICSGTVKTNWGGKAPSRWGFPPPPRFWASTRTVVEHHRALDDSLLALKCLQKLYRPEDLAAHMQDACQQEFYDRMLFKTVIISDLNNPNIRRSDAAVPL